MITTTYESRMSVYAPSALIVVGLLLVLLAGLTLIGAPVAGVGQGSSTPEFTPSKIVGQLNLAPPPYCPKGPGTHSKGKPPADTPGKGDPGNRGRPCG